jgi:hypothetical protein
MKPGIGASVGFEEGTDPGRIVDDEATIIVCGSHVEAESVPVGRMVWGAWEGGSVVVGTVVDGAAVVGGVVVGVDTMVVDGVNTALDVGSSEGRVIIAVPFVGIVPVSETCVGVPVGDPLVGVIKDANGVEGVPDVSMAVAFEGVPDVSMAVAFEVAPVPVGENGAVPVALLEMLEILERSPVAEAEVRLSHAEVIRAVEFDSVAVGVERGAELVVPVSRMLESMPPSPV